MAELLKNKYTKSYIENLALEIKKEYALFDDAGFVASVFDTLWGDLELKGRMRHIALRLGECLPLSYAEQLAILKPVSKHFYSYEAMFFEDFVALFGMNDFEESMQGLALFTVESSSEFAIREFILQDEKRTMSQLRAWTKSEDEHLRRLASEGCRPRLPWAVALQCFKKDPSEVFKIIELLKNDTSKYVRKSVANNLNDISKDHPDLVLAFVQKNLGISKELDWICKHGSRTLLKQGDIRALKLFGFAHSGYVYVGNFTHEKVLQINDTMTFSFELRSKEIIGNVRVEYAIDYLKANKTHKRKVFMISQNEVKEFSKSFTKKQSFKNLTTRKHYAGKHYISILINGEEKVRSEFLLGP
ncbi:DNA alkylation repair protein [Sulfurimonas sp.]|uniref:DNA alkylation repair protein n=1 Tax=Sulfurimonas sp. TaxID=2022749 RepID=UPI0026189B07|nr:DNA alkylation repair protein [Sulfurimonas sp.]